MDDDPVPLRVPNKFLEIFFQILDHLCPDGMRTPASFACIWQGCERGNPPTHAAFSVGVQCALQGWIGKREADALAEFCPVHRLFWRLGPDIEAAAVYPFHVMDHI